MSGRNVIRFDFRSGLCVMGRCLRVVPHADSVCHSPIAERALAAVGLHHILDDSIGSMDKIGL